jgi:NAD(P)-dependent dehydrogenase (short-subunit alcohol dehydrogenase family)
MTTGAVSVISGGSDGIGLAVAECLAAGGGRIAVLGRDRENLELAKGAVEEAGADAVLALSADVTKDDEVAAAFREIDTTWGKVHALINAVGPSGAGRFEDLSDEAWVRAFDQGALTAVRCIRHALPLLRRAEWGRIVNITAVSVQHQSTGLIGYTASKAALASITKNLARSLAADGILVNAVAPGPVLTGPIKAAVRAAHGDPDDVHDAYRVMAEHFGSAVDLGRVAGPAEIAEVVAFCASAANTYMTGAHLNVDGGSDFT